MSDNVALFCFSILNGGKTQMIELLQKKNVFDIIYTRMKFMSEEFRKEWSVL